MKALGLIEVNGYVAGIEAADAALKAANVTLIALEKVNAGITNVQITGDVGAVKAAVDAGKLAAEALGMLRAYHVIPRLHEETLKLFPSMNKEVTNEANITGNKKEPDNNEDQVNNSSFKVDEKFKREVIGTNKQFDTSIRERSKEVQDDIVEKNKEIQGIKDSIEQKNKQIEDTKNNIIQKNKEMEDIKNNLIKKNLKEENNKNKDNITNEVKEEKNEDVKENINKGEKQKKGEFVLEEKSKLNKQRDLVDYSGMRVDELRKLVSNLKLPHLTNKQIKFEKKDELIKILLEYGRKDGK